MSCVRSCLPLISASPRRPLETPGISGRRVRLSLSESAEMPKQTPSHKRRSGRASTASFQLLLNRRLSQARLSPEAQQALLGAVEVANDAGNRPEEDEASEIKQWLGPAPQDSARLEFEALQARFARRRDLLQHCIGTNEVARLLAVRNRQTPLDRLKARTLLAIREQGQWRFPLWQFDPDGPDGVIAGLPEVLAALPVADLIKAQWLQRPQPQLDGQTPLRALRAGQLDRVLAEARAVGCGQD